MVEAIELSRNRNPFDLWAWVILPEHIHILFHPHGAALDEQLQLTGAPASHPQSTCSIES